MINLWVMASVCVVWKERSRKHVALILRPKDMKLNLSGRWFFPGGSVEAGEQPEVTAIRETNEETGIKVENLRLMDVHTTHEFWKDKDILRRVNVVHAFYEGFFAGGKLTPTAESEDVIWAAKKDLKKYLERQLIRTHVPESVRKQLDL